MVKISEQSKIKYRKTFLQFQRFHYLAEHELELPQFQRAKY